MTTSGAIYFLGKYRPAYFEGDTLQGVACQMLTAIRTVDDEDLRDWLRTRIHRLVGELERGGVRYTELSSDHCDRGVGFARRPHDPFLDSVTTKMPACPGLDYSASK